ncbi:hypothetical protein [Halanaerobium sp. ST460_2HS_T2]|nr:hypothetical protein [Halanaerobium sp. ST460_2HS_T2]
MKLIKDSNFDIPKLFGLEVSKSSLKAYDITKLQLLQNEKVIIIRCFI